MISVIIPTLERAQAVCDAIDDVLQQLPPGGELLVVDQSGWEAVFHVSAHCKRHNDPRLTHMILGERGLPNARNVGLKATVQPIVLFLDDDVRLGAGCIEAHLRAFDDRDLGGAVGRVHEHKVVANHPVVANEMTPGGRIIANLDGDEERPVQLLKGANMSFRRAAIEAVGGFDPNYRGTALLEDADASERVRQAGWLLRFLPAAALEHLSVPAGGVRVGSQSLTEQWRFHNTGYFVRRHRSSLALAMTTSTFAAISVKRAIEWRDPRAPVMLLAALFQGWLAASSPPMTEATCRNSNRT